MSLSEFAASSSGAGDEHKHRHALNICVVCGDESDGLHFGRFTCRACAAFFRRTVSLKLQYTCKRDGNCEVDKAARNMCRACRYQKCIDQGMLTSAVQHTRDGIGKRSSSALQQHHTTTSMSSTDSPPGDTKIARAGGASLVAVPSTLLGNIALKQQQPQQHQQQHQHFLGASSGYGSGLSPSSSSSLLLDQQHQHHQQVAPAATAAAGATIIQLGQPSAFGPFAASISPSSSSSASASVPHAQHHHFLLGAGEQPAQLQQQSQQLLQHPYSLMGNFSNLQLQQAQPLTLASVAVQPQPPQPTSTTTGGNHVELKYLRKMLDGYHHFLSLRKASYTLVDGFPLGRRDNEDCPQSNFGTSKKICKIEASLIMDIVEKFFHPFSQLSADDKHKLFDPFYCLFSNAERAFRTYKMFDAGDDRLLMPDGGFVRLSELQKFYENNTLVRGDPSQVAKIFENALNYLVRTVVAHMRNIELSEMELVALFGMFIWSDSEEVSTDTLQLALNVRNDIIVDMHMHYRAQGLSESEVTLKTANLFLLIPKLENSVRMLREDFNIADIFNMVGSNGAGSVQDSSEDNNSSTEQDSSRHDIEVVEQDTQHHHHNQEQDGSQHHHHHRNHRRKSLPEGSSGEDAQPHKHEVSGMGTLQTAEELHKDPQDAQVHHEATKEGLQRAQHEVQEMEQDQKHAKHHHHDEDQEGSEQGGQEGTGKSSR